MKRKKLKYKKTTPIVRLLQNVHRLRGQIHVTSNPLGISPYYDKYIEQMAQNLSDRIDKYLLDTLTKKATE